MSNEFLETYFKENQKKINEIRTNVENNNENNVVSQFTYGFIPSTLAEALEFGVVPRQIRFITDARKSGEGAGNGTGLPAFYDEILGWVDFMGNVITV